MIDFKIFNKMQDHEKQITLATRGADAIKVYNAEK